MLQATGMADALSYARKQYLQCIATSARVSTRWRYRFIQEQVQFVDFLVIMSPRISSPVTAPRSTGLTHPCPHDDHVKSRSIREELRNRRKMPTRHFSQASAYRRRRASRSDSSRQRMSFSRTVQS